ncbi:MAG: hypothetical protein LBV79_12580 [Candidatus Adiutrix sp.]|jgi:hypothetical protein|nr:hypothetical protein [Candidatus Adiutrix sp.]
MKNILKPLMVATLLLAVAACAAPVKYSADKLPLCSAPSDTGVVKLSSVPYTKEDPQSCAVALKSVDVAVWSEAAYNSRKLRGLDTVELGYKPLLAATGDASYHGPTGHANSLVVNFDTTVFEEDTAVRRAYLAVYSPDNPQGLNGVVLRGRLSTGDELQSLARERRAVTNMEGTSGWIFFDVSFFVARAINERRNSIHFELSVPGQPAAGNLVRVGVTKKEPHLVVEYN